MDPLQIFLRKLRERISQDISEQAELLVDAKSIGDYAAYKEKVGYMRGLKYIGDIVLPEVSRLVMREEESPLRRRIPRHQQGMD